MRPACILLPCLLLMARGGPVAGQDTPAATAPTTPAWRVNLPDASATAGKLRLIDEAVVAREFDRAGRLAAEFFADPACNLLPDPSAANDQPARFVDARRVLEQRMSRWPDEALRAYANRVSVVAESRLQAAGRNRALRQAVLDEFLYTDSGMECGQALLAEDLEAGHFAQVLRTAQRLLLRPLPEERAARTMLYLAIAQHALGMAPKARSTLGGLARDYPRVVLRIAGRDVPAGQVTPDILQPAAAKNAPALVPGPLVWTRDMGELPNTGRDERQRKRTADWMNRLRDDGVLLGVGAASDGEVLVINRGHEIVAMRLADGATPMPWKAANPPDGVLKGAQPESLRWLQRLQYASAIGPHLCVAVGDGVALAYTGSGALLPTDDSNASIQPRQTLHCIDLASGKVLWTNTPRTLVPAHMPQELYYSGQPIIDGGRGYLLMRGPHAAAGQECRLACINLRDGRVLWTRVLGAAILQGTRLIVPEDEEAYVSDPALDGGRTFVATNLGVLAAVDAHSGRVAWVAAYPHRMHVAQRHPSPWRLPQNHSPVLAVGGRVFSLPLDSPYVLVHDAESGRELHRHRRDQAGNPTMLLGATENLLLLGEEKRLLAVRCQPPEGVAWQADVPPIRGRALLRSDVLYVFTIKGLMSLDARSGQALRTVWPAPLAGNLLTVEGKLLLVGERQVSAWMLEEPTPQEHRP